MNMRDLLSKQDWIRIVLMVAFSGYLLHQIHKKTEMLLERELGFAERETDSQEMKSVKERQELGEQWHQHLSK